MNDKIVTLNRLNPLSAPTLPTYSAAAIDSLKQYDKIRNMQDLIYRTAIGQEHQLTISGADDKSKFMFSANYLKKEGIVKNSALERLGFRMNYERDLFKNLKMNAKLNYSNSKNNMILQSQGSGDLGSNAILGVITFNP
jgi:hypothetical protein